MDMIFFQALLHPLTFSDDNPDTLFESLTAVSSYDLVSTIILWESREMLRVLELYCGIGGFAQASGTRARVVAAIDQSELALSVYRLNYPETPVICRNIETISTKFLRSFTPDMWWLSPPCQPYTVRGKRRDIDDPRAASLLNLIRILPEAPPLHLGMENVEGYATSRARELLLKALSISGFRVHERLICPTELGIPSRRPRYYLIASQGDLPDVEPPRPFSYPLKHFLESDPGPGLQIPRDVVDRFGKGMNTIDVTDPDAYTTCFTSSYGKALMRSGSYLYWREGVRYFSPDEIIRLLGFPRGFKWPPTMTLRKRWHLAGNSISVFALREVLRIIPHFRN